MLESMPHAVAAQDGTQRSVTLSVDSSNTLDRRTLEVQIENAGFNFALAREQCNQLNSEMSPAPELEPVLSLERDLAEKRVAQLDQQFALYTAAFDATLTRESEQADAELARAQQAVEVAGTPDERFITDWEARSANPKKGKSDVEAQLVNTRRGVSDEEKQLTAETGEASAIKEFIDKSGSSDFVGECLKRTLQQLHLRQQLLERALERVRYSDSKSTGPAGSRSKTVCLGSVNSSRYSMTPLPRVNADRPGRIRHAHEHSARQLSGRGPRRDKRVDRADFTSPEHNCAYSTMA